MKNNLKCPALTLLMFCSEANSRRGERERRGSFENTGGKIPRAVREGQKKVSKEEKKK